MIGRVQFNSVLSILIFFLYSGTSAETSSTVKSITNVESNRNINSKTYVDNHDHDTTSAKYSTSTTTDRQTNERIERTSSLIISLFGTRLSHFDKTFGKFSQDETNEMLNLARNTFQFAYDNYVQYAFPLDELNPIHCTGRGPDFIDRSNININDVLGNFSLTLIDSLDTLLVMGNYSEFENALRLVIDNVNFNQDTIVQVFETTIRVIGGLLSAHLLMQDNVRLFGSDVKPTWYKDELLHLAKDLAERLLPALETSTTGLPFPRVHLREGVPNSTLCHWCRTETCPAAAGSLLLEFGVLSRITNDSRFEIAAIRSLKSLWLNRGKTGLVGNAIDAENLEWLGEISGVGAGIDSFYEYLLKSWILFGEKTYWNMFMESYLTIKHYQRKGRATCNSGIGTHPVYVNVNMNSGKIMTQWIDSLSASWSAVQILAGDVEEAICSHAFHYGIWRKFGMSPERFNWKYLKPDVSFYPLRPELAESTYMLYQATKNPFYLHVGRDILLSINKYTKSQCGYATVHNVEDKSLEDRMESFFLSETCKYLYLLFDKENPLNRNSKQFLFSTQGHIIPLNMKEWRQKSVDIVEDETLQIETLLSKYPNLTKTNCDPISDERRFLTPLKTVYFEQLGYALDFEY